MHLLTAIALVVLLSSSASGSQGPAGEAIDALDGLDPVLLVGGKEVQGKSAFSVTRGGLIYLFSTADSKATFERDPARYEIQLGGMCAKMGKTAGGNPADYIVHDGKIYVFGSDDCHKKFQAEPAKYLATPPAPLPASPGAATRGRELVERAVAAIGGAARLDALTSYVESLSQTQKRPQGDATITVRTMRSFPDRVRQERTIALQGKTMSSATILAPQGLWFVSGQGQAYPMRPFSRASLEQDFGRHPVALLRARRSPAFKAVAVGPTTVDGVAVEQVRIVHGGIDVTIGIEPGGRIHSTAFRDRNNDGEYGAFAVAYSDFRPVDGLQLPFSARTTFNGAPDPGQSVTVDSIALNTPLDLSLFAPKGSGDR